MNPTISVVVPVFNEARNVSILAEEIRNVLLTAGESWECVFVNDGSTDGTGRELERLCRGGGPFRALHFARNAGQSAALITGLRAARGEYIVTLDGDLQNDPADIPRVVELLKRYDCVCGVRANRRDGLVKRLSSRIANRVRGLVLGDGIQDAGCGTKGFRRACIEHLPAFNGIHRFFAVFIREAGFTLAECTVNHRPRVHGTSKYGIHNRLWRGLYDLAGVAWLRRRYVAYTIVDAPAASADDTAAVSVQAGKLEGFTVPKES
jgi:dolichol-phosphate mannosyltransferase